MNRFAVSFLSLLTLAPAALAQDAGHDLSTNAPAGITVWFAETSKNVQEIDMGGQAMTSGQTLTRNFRLTVKEVAEDGSRTVELEVARVYGSIEMPMLGEMKIDSAKTGADDEGGFGMPQIDEMKSQMTAMAGRKYLAKVNAQGKVVGDVKLVDAKDEDDGSQAKDLLQIAFGMRPKGKVAEGGKWDVTNALAAGQMPLRHKTEAKLTKVTDEAFETDHQGSVEKDDAAQLPDATDEDRAMAAEMLEGMSVSNGKVSGKQRLNRKDGLVADASQTMTADVAMETPMGEMAMKLKSTTSIKRITEAEAKPMPKKDEAAEKAGTDK